MKRSIIGLAVLSALLTAACAPHKPRQGSGAIERAALEGWTGLFLHLFHWLRRRAGYPMFPARQTLPSPGKSNMEAVASYALARPTCPARR